MVDGDDGRTNLAGGTTENDSGLAAVGPDFQPHTGFGTHGGVVQRCRFNIGHEAFGDADDLGQFG